MLACTALNWSYFLYPFLFLKSRFRETLLYYTLRVMMHEPRLDSYDAPTGDCMQELMEFAIMYDTMIEIYSERTGKPDWQIDEDMKRDYYMSPEQAQAYGIIDAIAESLWIWKNGIYY